MARLKRTWRMETFPVSVSRETKARLREAADRPYGGNVSALIEAIALEADRQNAFDWLLRRSPTIEDAPFEAFMAEMAGRKRKRSRRGA